MGAVQEITPSVTMRGAWGCLGDSLISRVSTQVVQLMLCVARVAGIG